MTLCANVFIYLIPVVSLVFGQYDGTYFGTYGAVQVGGF